MKIRSYLLFLIHLVIEGRVWSSGECRTFLLDGIPQIREADIDSTKRVRINVRLPRFEA